ncbi:hypothetical protein CONLIGDRAFT_453291 [Coniochaeta ligniaria NRRL 30616]|uniref:Uncharacterized protein n=1 Tax=Coniochaeta ligniaria NRRL 30616 TaxID=1408157 RepID=A0A1J7JDR5_9PEZI|nr:hypothetical protein CONLIGDRAFT_453291 [Coniochaeta ligniaria NRRL 30616]
MNQSYSEKGNDDDYRVQAPQQPYASQVYSEPAPPQPYQGNGYSQSQGPPHYPQTSYLDPGYGGQPSSRPPPPPYSDQEFRAQAAPVAALMSDDSRLPNPIVIPQRRPKDRTRGFVRAYAPDLLRCGIDQATFLRFIDGLNASVAASGAVQAINLAGSAAGAVPASVFIGAPIIGLAVQVAAGVYTEVSARKGQNAFLTKMNDELFRPRGLYCLVMSYDINSRSNLTRPGESPDHSEIIHRGMSSASTSKAIRGNDGSLGAANFPATAQLVYPDPNDPPVHGFDDTSSDDESHHQPGSSGGNKFSNMLASLAEKKDLKTQVKFQKKNPTSLINPLMDPKAELSEKDLRKQHKREAKQERRDDKRERKAERRERKGKAAKVRKIKEGVLYLMIVNMPSNQDMQTAHDLVGNPK